MTPKNLSALKREKERIEKEGMISGCRIVVCRSGGTARGNHIYYQLRSKEPFENGKRTRYLKSAQEITHYRRLIENGKRWKRIIRDIAWLESGKQPRRATMTSSASDEWYTPPEYISLAREVMGGIDCDPASNELAQMWIEAGIWYDSKSDGLKQPWQGRVWLNPPYGKQVGLWTGRATEDYAQGKIQAAVILVRPATGSSWYQELIRRFPCCQPHKRIRFIDHSGTPQTSPVHGNAFFYLGEDVRQFAEVFAAVGVVTVPV